MRRCLVMSVLVAATLLAACQDPFHDKSVEALGPEANGVPKGPLHRPGQPCLVCHGDAGPAGMIFSLAGTIYQYAPPGDPSLSPSSAADAPASDVLVHFRDTNGREYSTGSNCAGNFFVQPGDYDPTFPVAVWLEYAGVISIMNSQAFRERSCAGCHKAGMPTFDSPGPVYFRPSFTFPDLNPVVFPIAHPPGACQ